MLTYYSFALSNGIICTDLVPYMLKFPGENFRQFRQCMLLAKIFSANLFA